MPEFLAFRGLRYRGRTDASSVTAPPYDVIHGDDGLVIRVPDGDAVPSAAAAFVEYLQERATELL